MLLTSLLLGGMTSEVGYLLTDGEISINALFPAVGFFVLLTIIYMFILQRKINKFK